MEGTRHGKNTPHGKRQHLTHTKRRYSSGTAIGTMRLRRCTVSLHSPKKDPGSFLFRLVEDEWRACVSHLLACGRHHSKTLRSNRALQPLLCATSWERLCC